MSDVFDLVATLKQLPQWRSAEGRDAIQRKFRFKDFPAAWGFLSQVAVTAAMRNQYPEFINNCEKITIILRAGEDASFGESHVAMAKAIDAALPPLPVPAGKPAPKLAAARSR